MSPAETMNPPESASYVHHGSEPRLLYDKCLALAQNLWWTWHPDVISLFRDLDRIRSRCCESLRQSDSTCEPRKWSCTAGSITPIGA
jgi:hypothetical protein